MTDTHEPGTRFWALVEPYWERISIYDWPDVFLKEWQRTPAVSADLFAAHWCQEEVCNGGLQQFFLNITGVLGPEAIVAFERMGIIVPIVLRA